MWLSVVFEIKLLTLYNKELSQGIPAADPPMERNNHSALDVKPVNAGGLNGLTWPTLPSSLPPRRHDVRQRGNGPSRTQGESHQIADRLRGFPSWWPKYSQIHSGLQGGGDGGWVWQRMSRVDEAEMKNRIIIAYRSCCSRHQANCVWSWSFPCC